jgi:hypothetical protein
MGTTASDLAKYFTDLPPSYLRERELGMHAVTVYGAGRKFDGRCTVLTRTITAP